MKVVNVLCEKRGVDEFAFFVFTFDKNPKDKYNFNMKEFERTENLIGKENFKKIRNAKIIIFGLGGVGGYVTEMLVRSGINNLTIVDFDKVDISNINRQIIATHSSLNQNKTEAFEKRILDINPSINLKFYTKKVCEQNLTDFNLMDYDYVIDAIDSFKDKMALIKYCLKNRIKIISSMGAGNRFFDTTFEIVDISKTKNDKLARKIRLELKKCGNYKLKVCCSNTISQNESDKNKVFSISYVVASCGIKIASYVINQIIKN